MTQSFTEEGTEIHRVFLMYRSFKPWRLSAVARKLFVSFAGFVVDKKILRSSKNLKGYPASLRSLANFAVKKNLKVCEDTDLGGGEFWLKASLSDTEEGTEIHRVFLMYRSFKPWRLSAVARKLFVSFADFMVDENILRGSKNLKRYPASLRSFANFAVKET